MAYARGRTIASWARLFGPWLVDSSGTAPSAEVTFADSDQLALTPWLELDRRSGDVGNAIVTSYHAFVGHAINAHDSTYYGGPKSATLLSLSPITRELSGEDGSLRTSPVSVTLEDTDRGWRPTLLSDTVKGQQFIVRVIDTVRAAASETPKTLARVLQKSPTWNSNLSVTFKGDDVLSALLGASGGDVGLQPATLITKRHFPTIASDSKWLNQGIPIVYGEHLDESQLHGPIPLIPVGLVDLGGTDWMFSVAMLGACTDMPKLWRNGEQITDGNVDFLRPGGTQWNANANLDVGGANVTYWTTPSGLRVTGVFSTWTKWPEVVNESWKLTCTIQGVEDSGNGDGTGTCITRLSQQLKHFLINRVFGEQLTIPLAAPTYEDGTAKIDTASFDAVGTIADARISGGYVGRWRAGTARTRADEIIAMVVRSFGGHVGQTWDGQLRVALFDKGQAAVMAVAHEGTGTIVRAGSFDVTLDDDQHANQITYDFGALYGPEGESGYLKANASVRDVASILKYGRVYDSAVLKLDAVEDPLIAYDIAYHALLKRTNPPQTIALSLSLGGLDLETGHTIALTHQLGLTSTGWTARKGWTEALSLTIDRDTKRMDVTVRARDQDAVTASLTISSPVVGITRSGSTVTVEKTAHSYATGDIITHSGADQTAYNGSWGITRIDADHYSHYIAEPLPATPATGSILAGTYDEGQMKVFTRDVREVDALTGTGPLVPDELSLGGSSTPLQTPAATTWVPVEPGMIVLLDKAQFGRRRVVVNCWPVTANAGTSVTPRFATLSGVDVIAGSSMTSTTPTKQELVVQDFDVEPEIDRLADGEVEYRLELQRSNTSNAVGCTGHIRQK